MNSAARHVMRFACFLMTVLAVADVSAATYQVGATRSYARLQDVTSLLAPGDIVEVDGGASYASGVLLETSGTADRRITIRGVRVGGKRPIISGTDRFGFEINADYITVEGFEITGGITKAGIGQYGHEVKISDCLLHDFPNADGIIGYGSGTGNTIIEYTEIHHTGNTAPSGGRHQIYMATDEHSHPGSVFRLQYCYIHDAIGNSDVKSRSERNEIYYNWLESPGFHDMDLYGIDPEDNENVTEDTKREDSDVVGNVVVCNPSYACARIGGDGTGNSKGRFRFVNNTFIQTGSGDIIRTFQDVETLEMYNNVIYNSSAGSTTRVLNDSDGSWVHGSRLVIGKSNFIVTGATEIPTQLTGTVTGSTPTFVDAAGFNFTPAAGSVVMSVLIDAGAMSTPTVESYPFANPLFPPVAMPPSRAAVLPGSATSRPSDGAIDIGAIEAGPAVGAGGTGAGGTGAGGATGAGGGAGGNTLGTGGAARDGGVGGGNGGRTLGRDGSVGSGGVITGVGGVGGRTAGAGGGFGSGGNTTGAGGIVGGRGGTPGRDGSVPGSGGATTGPGSGGAVGSPDAGIDSAGGGTVDLPPATGGVTGSADAAVQPGNSSSSGCGCRLTSATAPRQAFFMVLGIGLIWRLSRRRPR